MRPYRYCIRPFNGPRGRSLEGGNVCLLSPFEPSIFCRLPHLPQHPGSHLHSLFPPQHLCLDSARLGLFPRHHSDIRAAFLSPTFKHHHTPLSRYRLAFLAISLSKNPSIRSDPGLHHPLFFLTHLIHPGSLSPFPNISLFNALHTVDITTCRTRNRSCSDRDPGTTAEMSETGRTRASASQARAPLADATQRINNASSKIPVKSSKSRDKNTAHSQNAAASDRQRHTNDYDPPVSGARATAAPTGPPSARNPAVARARASHDVDPSKRMSQASQASTTTSSKRSSGYAYKTHIGPWLLGRTLGKGSSARVRLCKHRLSGELAAVKIVPKKTAYLIQAGSLAELHDYDDSLPEKINGEMRVPLSIEREVAILKLVDHPNVMKVYDIWENRSEMLVATLALRQVPS